MNKLRALFLMIVVAGPLFFCSACISLTSPAPAIKYYTLQSHKTPETPINGTQGPTLHLRPVRASDTVDRRNFLIRTSDVQIEEDFYHRWLVKPSKAIEDELYIYLAASGKFSEVSRGVPKEDVELILEIFLNRFEVDLQGENPSANIAGYITVRQRSQDGGYDVTRSTFIEGRKLLDAKTPDNMARSWKKAADSFIEQVTQAALTQSDH